MKQIPISVFRAKCCEILEDERRTRLPIRVTRYGKAFVDVLPPTKPKRQVQPARSLAVKSRNGIH